MSKSAFVAIVGRPSAGKSTLMNALCGQKVSIVSPVPQTTRNAIRGILNGDRGQLVFVDTPGFHQSDKKLNLKLSDLVRGSLSDADLVLYVLDVTREPGEEEELLSRTVAKVQKPILVLCNKCDQANPAMVARAAEYLKERIPGCTVLEISALQQTGLDTLKDTLYTMAAEGHAWYPDDFYTDQDPDFRVAELIREQVMNRTREEVPHATWVEVEEMTRSMPDGSPVPEDFDMAGAWDLPVSKKPRLTIRASIVVERDSQKGIVIGKGGELIKEIRQAAEAGLREIFPYYIELNLKVKVDATWRGNDKLLKSMIH